MLIFQLHCSPLQNSHISLGEEEDGWKQQRQLRTEPELRDKRKKKYRKREKVPDRVMSKALLRVRVSLKFDGPLKEHLAAAAKQEGTLWSASRDGADVPMLKPGVKPDRLHLQARLSWTETSSGQSRGFNVFFCKPSCSGGRASPASTGRELNKLDLKSSDS